MNSKNIVYMPVLNHSKSPDLAHCQMPQARKKIIISGQFLSPVAVVAIKEILGKLEQIPLNFQQHHILKQCIRLIKDMLKTQNPNMPESSSIGPASVDKPLVANRQALQQRTSANNPHIANRENTETTQNSNFTDLKSELKQLSDTIKQKDQLITHLKQKIKVQSLQFNNHLAALAKKKIVQEFGGMDPTELLTSSSHALTATGMLFNRKNSEEKLRLLKNPIQEQHSKDPSAFVSGSVSRNDELAGTADITYKAKATTQVNQIGRVSKASQRIQSNIRQFYDQQIKQICERNEGLEQQIQKLRGEVAGSKLQVESLNQQIKSKDEEINQLKTKQARPSQKFSELRSKQPSLIEQIPSTGNVIIKQQQKERLETMASCLKEECLDLESRIIYLERRDIRQLIGYSQS